MPGELRSLAELLEEVNDGEDREDRDEVTVGRDQTQRRGLASLIVCNVLAVEIN